jgi:hypothetical protein
MPPLPSNANTERSIRPQHLHYHSVADFYVKNYLFLCACQKDGPLMQVSLQETCVGIECARRGGNYCTLMKTSKILDFSIYLTEHFCLKTFEIPDVKNLT